MFFFPNFSPIFSILNHLTDLNSRNFLWPRLILQARLLLWLGSSPAPVAELKDCYLQTLQIVYKRNYANLVPVYSARFYRWMLPKLPTNLSACKPASPFQSPFWLREIEILLHDFLQLLKLHTGWNYVHLTSY